jgi:hypothetical protein
MKKMSFLEHDFLFMGGAEKSEVRGICAREEALFKVGPEHHQKHQRRTFADTNNLLLVLD